MPGRHASRASRTRSRWPRRIAVGTVAVVAVGAAGFGVTQVLDDQSSNCGETLSITVTADPAIAPTLVDIAATFDQIDRAVDGACVDADVVAAPAADTIDLIGSDSSPDVWIPDSSLWTTRVADPESLTLVGSVATTPLVVVAPRSKATALGWPEAEFSWNTALEGGQASLPDPTSTSEGLVSLLAVRSALGESIEPTELVRVMTGMSRNTVATVQAAYDTVAAEADAAPLFTATEQSVVAYNTSSGQNSVVALYPAEGTLAFDYPAFAVRPAGAAPGARAAAVNAFVEFVQSTPAQDALLAAGFRTPDGVAAESAGVVDGIASAMPVVLPTPEPEVVTELTRQWAALALDMRMLAVIDVSGSMKETAEGGATRIELTRDAAKSALGLLRPESSVGLWAFSILQDPPRDYVELVSVGPLSEQIGSATRLEALAAAADSLPGRADGGTGLYDTTLAAFQQVRSTYEPGKINSVVLMTDGRNEDDPGSVDLATLLTTLKAQFDPAAPVPIITIGMGPDADMDALSQISEATGTQAYQAADPRDIEEVFLKAMIERQCRPNC